MGNQSIEAKDDLIRRLRRIEGQVRGVQKMIEDNQEPSALLQQLTAISSAVRGVGLRLIQAQFSTALEEAGGYTYQELREKKEELINLLDRVP